MYFNQRNKAQGDVFCYHYDANENTTAVTDASGTIVNTYEFLPFGEIAAKTETISQPFTFVGQYGVMAEPNGLYYMRARYYDPELGRFISQDPAGFDGGDVNFYVYCLNNPTNAVDPWGLCADNRSFGDLTRDYMTERGREVASYMQGQYVQQQFGQFAYAATASPVDLVVDIANSLGADLPSGNEAIGGVANNAGAPIAINAATRLLMH